uniref:Uncharacterized protein n=1 Tax=Ditylenchus dipsaci TaxID=166011 RepID=A0A915ETV0_9BILA
MPEALRKVDSSHVAEGKSMLSVGSSKPLKKIKPSHASRSQWLHAEHPQGAIKEKAGSTEDLSAAGKLKAKTEEEKKKKKAKTRKTQHLERKVVKEEKTSVKKVSAKKEVSSGGANEHQKVSSNTSSTEVRVSSFTTTEEKERKAKETASGSYIKSVTEKEKQVSKVKSAKQVENVVKEQEKESREMFEVKLRKTENGVRLLQGQVALDDLEKDKLVISTKVYGEKTEGALVAEKKKKLKAKVDLNGELEAASTEVSKKLVLTTPNGALKYEHKQKKVTKQTVHRSLGNLLTSDSDINKKDVTFSHDTLLADSSKDTNKKKVKPKTEEVSLDRKLKSENNLVSDPKKSASSEKPKVKFLESLQSEEIIEPNEDAFDFSLLRKKLQQRIMGCKDDEDLATEMENKQKCEQRVQLADTGNTKRAMNKWLVMDKEAKSNPLTWRSDEW